MLKKILAAINILIWLAAMLAGLWWYKSKYIRSAVFFGEELILPEQLAGAGKIRLVHFWDPACPCNLGNQQHLADLLKDYSNQIDFYHVQKPGSKGHLPSNLAGMQSLTSITGMEQLPASPVVAIWSSQGRLAYIGPYSEGAICTASNSFVEPILDALLAGRQVRAGSSLATGCFCDWQEASTAQNQ